MTLEDEASEQEAEISAPFALRCLWLRATKYVNASLREQETCLGECVRE